MKNIRSFLLFSFCLIWPSTAIFKKLGYPLLFLYCLLAFSALVVCAYWLLPRIRSYLTKPAISVSIVTVLLLSLSTAFFIIYPQIDINGFLLVGKKFGACDCDNGIKQGINSILHGRYPYYERSFLGGRLSPMPGAFLLAFPFYVLGMSAFQNIFWIGLFIGGIGLYFKSWLLASATLLAMLLLSPSMTYQVLIGADYIANTLYVLIFTALLFESTKKEALNRWSLLWAILLGIGLSSRANFMFITPLLFSALIKRIGFKQSFGLMTITGAAWCFVTLPFLFYDIANFTPLGTSTKLSLAGRYPWAPSLVVILGLITTSVLALRYIAYAPSLLTLFMDMFIVQLLFVALGTLITSIGFGHFNFEYANFGLFFSFFGIFAFMPSFLDPKVDAPPP